MDGIDFENVGKAVGFAGVVAGAAWGIWRGERKSDGKPPEERNPTTHEVRAALDSMRDKLDRHHDLTTEDLNDIRRAMDRIEASLRLMEKYLHITSA